jgi:hypothetical protein
MATITVSSSTTLALLGHGADDDAVITGAAALTCNSDPSLLPALRSIVSSSPRASFVVRNTATAFAPGNLWVLNFTNPGALATNGVALFSNGASCNIEGEMLECYTATGVANETILNASNVLGRDIDEPRAIEAETSPGSGVYKSVPVIVVGGVGNGYCVTSARTDFGTGEVGRVLFYDHTTRLVTTGDGTNGSLFPSGTKFRIPNIWIIGAPFTMTTAAGWTTGTGSQNVVSSTNAPVLAAGNINYLVGSEVLNVSARPSGTTVTVNNRASDFTTAVAHAAGVTMYALPDVNGTMGRWAFTPLGSVSLKKVAFGRYHFVFLANIANPFGPLQVTIDRAWYVASPGGVPNQIGTSYLAATIRNFTAHCNLSRPAQRGVGIANMLGAVTIENAAVFAQGSSSAIGSYTASAALFDISQCPNVAVLSGLRVWRAGLPAVSWSTNLRGSVSLDLMVVTSGLIDGIEVVGAPLRLGQLGNVSIKGLRYSISNGAISSNTNDQMIQLSAGTSNARPERLVLYDWGILSGGVATWGSPIQFNSAANTIIHNKVGGVVQSIDFQNRTQSFVGNPTADMTFAAMTFTNVRAGGIVFSNNVSGARQVIRNVRWSNLSGSILSDVACSAPCTLATYDFPPTKPANNISNYTADTPSVQAAPYTYPALDGGIYFGPLAIKSSIDTYTLSGGAYLDTAGNCYIETTGDVVIVKATQKVTAVASVANVTPSFSGTNATSGLTYEFRLCKWGDDINAVSWAAFTGSNVQSAFNALTGYTSAIGLDIQLRITATTTLAGRIFRQAAAQIVMDVAYNPYVGSIDLDIIGAAASATAALYVGANLWTSGTTSGAGAITFAAPYDFDDVAVAGTLKIRALQSESIDAPLTWLGATSVPAPMSALTGYVAGPYAGASFNKGTKTVTVSSAMTTQQLWSAWREYIVQLANFDVTDEWTYPALNAGTWQVAFSGAGSVTGSYTDANGTRADITAPNLPTGTRVQIYDVTNNVELLNTSLASPGAVSSLYFTTPPTVRLRAAKLGELPIEAFGVMTASGLTFIDEFQTDAIYVEKGIDGSTVTEFTADEPNVQIDSDDPDGSTSAWRCYAWFRYYETSSLGIAGGLFGAATAIDADNLAFDSDKADIQLDNVSGVPLKIDDAYMYRTDGATIIAPTSGSIQMDPKKAYSAPAADLLAAELEAGFDVGRALRVIAAAVAGKTTGGPAGFTARNLSDTEDQIVGTATSDGNRTPTSYGA